MHEAQDFRGMLRRDLNEFVAKRAAAMGGEAIKIDLHCHDRNSDVPDETLGRLLRAPETWLPTDALVRTLRGNGADAITVTNHNNARSCWQLLERGEDVLSGAEFSCSLPDFNMGVHVLTFGFTPAQEEKLNRLRRNLYKFLEYASSEDIPTVLAHPLQFYSPGGRPPLELMDRFAVLFERFEGVNGQRDAWQNLLTLTWVEGLDAEGVEAAAKRTGIRPDAYCRNPYSKRITGGSDCHMGIFAGSTGTLLHSPGWPVSGESRADLALRALRSASMAPYGSHCEEEKLTVAFLDFFSQATLRMKDPGLLRLLLHRGSSKEKLLALGVANGMLELRRHKYTSRFLKLFHECLQGKKPGLLMSLMTKAAYKPMLAEMRAIAAARAGSAEDLVSVLREALPSMFHQLMKLAADRLTHKLETLDAASMGRLKTSELIGKVELPVHFRALFGLDSQVQGDDLTGLDIGKWSDGLPFPLLASGVLGGAAFASSKVLYGKRPFLNGFAERLGKYRHPRRALWLTDTLHDKNGVSHALRSMLSEARRRDLPVDFLACGAGESGDHLLTLPPLAEFKLPFYRDQPIRLPSLLDLQKIFLEGGYDRIVCSTEAPMGLFALYLKHAFSVPAYFYVHSDWLDFARRTLRFDAHKRDRLRRILRAFYRQFDGIFLLNNEQKEQFASPAMGISPEKLFLTGHWADANFQPRRISKPEVFPGVGGGDPVLLYAGRLSEEKGVLQLPGILKAIQVRIPQARLALAGTGPCLEQLRTAMPDGIFLGWMPPDKLAEAYSLADLLLLPSWFDTFSCSLLEALSCGLPAVAYRSKGPRDILSGERGGLLADSPSDMAAKAVELLEDPLRMHALMGKAMRRAADFKPGAIFDRLLSDIGLGEEGGSSIQKILPVNQPRQGLKVKPVSDENWIAELSSFIKA